MTTENKNVAGDLLFGFQLLMAWAFTVPQVIRSFYSTAGMTITWTMFCLAFVIINLFLAYGAYEQSRSRKAIQIVVVYANWFVLWFILFSIICVKGTWVMKDTVLTWLIIFSLVVLLVVRRRESLVATFSEPITRGIIGLILKGVPQLFIGYCIINAGRNDGLSGFTLAIGHVVVSARLFEICLAARQDGWHRKNIGMLISELGNEISWLVTTAIWFMY